MRLVVVLIDMVRCSVFFDFLKYMLVLVVIITATTISSFGQKRIGFIMPAEVDRVQIPFEEYSNLIAIPVTINGFLTLKFILDTGAESAILTEKIFGDLLGLHYVRDITVQGPGLIDSLSAFVATDIQMSLPGGIRGDGLNMLVLKEDYLELNKNLGEEIYGIIGYDIFSRFVINIDYEENMLTLYRPEKFKPRKSAETLELDIYNTKPYLKSIINQNGKQDSVRLMVDSGASHAVLLDVKSTDQIDLPETLVATRLGQGLGGEIPGFMGRMNGFNVNCFDFKDVLVSIPIDGAYLKAIKRGSRHGTIGGDLLTRFNVTFDYYHQKLYLNKSGKYRTPFEHDMSGLTLSVEGDNLDSLMITRVRKNSPAHHVGLQEGDIIIRANGLRAGTSSVSEFNAMLRRKDGMKIRMVVKRDGEKLKKVFRLKRMI